MRRLTAVVVAVTMAGVACTDNGDETPDPTVPTAVSTLPPTTVAGIDTIPEVIDAPYLNRVLAALDSVESEATMLIVTNKDFVQPAAELLGSIYNQAEFSNQTNAWITALQEDPQLSDAPTTSPARTTAVERVISSSRSCVYVAVNRTYPHRNLTQTEYVAIEPLDKARDPRNHNPTAWMITKNGVRNDGGQPSDPCPGS